MKDYSPRFQRQKTIGSYIVDFYCHKVKLVIELDGSQHYEEHTKAYDEERTQFLQAAGLQVIRFPNAMIDHDFEGACTAIHQTIQACLK